MTKVIKIEDIDNRYNLRTARGLQKISDNQLVLDLWNSDYKQIILQFTDLQILEVDENGKSIFLIDREKHPKILEGIKALEDKSLGLLTQVMTKNKIKGDFTFSSIISLKPDGDTILALNTKYPDYDTTVIGVTPSAKGKISTKDLILSKNEKDLGITQISSIIVEIVGINLDLSKTPAHINIDNRLRIMKAKKIISPIRHKITDPNILIEENNSKNILEPIKTLSNDINSCLNDTNFSDMILNDISKLVNVIEGKHNSTNQKTVELDHSDHDEVNNELPDTDSAIESDTNDEIADNLADIVQKVKTSKIQLGFKQNNKNDMIEDLDELDERGRKINDETIHHSESQSDSLEPINEDDLDNDEEDDVDGDEEDEDEGDEEDEEGDEEDEEGDEEDEDEDDVVDDDTSA